MSLFNVSSAKEAALIDRLASLGVREEDLDETFTRSSGPGGQHVNKTSTCVILVHRPTGLAVRCQVSRSQAMNRFLARRRLAERLEKIQSDHITEEQRHIEKTRRQKRKRSRRAQIKVLEAKKARSEAKALRRKVNGAVED
ncbi:MAG: peptide chain release factor-like protein [Deltaproteobacteria bacterium]|nr:peptide chain release factor-like protein [Deltaproteobacteria bacterium]